MLYGNSRLRKQYISVFSYENTMQDIDVLIILSVLYDTRPGLASFLDYACMQSNVIVDDFDNRFLMICIHTDAYIQQRRCCREITIQQ